MDPLLLIALVVGVAVIITVVLATKLDAFVALLLASVVIGLIAGQSLPGIAESITTGFGNTLASIGIVIGLGVAIGKILEVSGAAHAIAVAFLRLFGKGREPWAMTSIGSVISIPVFCDSGYVVTNPLARAIARLKGTGYGTLGLALAGGLVITHHFVPPTPGPLGVAGILGAEIGTVILVGLVITLLMIPVVTLYARALGPRLESQITEDVREAVYGRIGAPAAAGDPATSSAAPAETAAPVDAGAGSGTGYEGPEGAGDGIAPEIAEAPAGKKPHRVNVFIGLLPLVIPILLIVGNTVVTAIDRNQQGVLEGDFEPSAWAEPLIFIGNPVIALLVGLVLAVYVLLPRWTPQKTTHRWLGEAAASAGLILLITGAGGALGQVLRDAGIGDALAEAVGSLPLPSFLLPFVIATVVRIAQGSGTVAMITAAGVTAPLVTAVGLDPVVAVMACVAGAMVASHYNDSYFWVVTRLMGLEGTAALKAQTGMTTVMWAASIPMLFVLDLIF